MLLGLPAVIRHRFQLGQEVLVQVGSKRTKRDKLELVRGRVMSLHLVRAHTPAGYCEVVVYDIRAGAARHQRVPERHLQGLSVIDELANVVRRS